MAPPKEENGDDGQSSTPEYRDRLRTWLIKMIDSGTIPGLHWENEEKTIFRMPWKHAGRQDYSLEEDSRIFMAWAIHSGRYREGIDKPEPIIWKTRLRCALNKMPDIREIPERSRLDISEPYRVYHFLPPVHKDTQIRRRLQRRHSQAQNSDPIAINSRQNSPTYNGSARKEATSIITPGQAEFQDIRLQNRANEKLAGVSHTEFNTRPRLDVRNQTAWLRSPTLVPGSENALLNGLNLNCLTSPIGVRNFVNPYNLFSVPHRDLRQRPEFDFPLLSYPHGSVLDHQALQPFFIPPSSISGITSVSGKSMSATAPFSRNLSLAAMAAEDFRKRSQKAGRIITDGYSPAARSRAVVDEKRQPYDETTSHARNSEYHRKQNSPECTQTKSRFDESEEQRCKIELLELELEKWKQAHEKEKELRQSLEKQHEHLKRALENMGGDLLAMIMRNYPMNEKRNHEKHVSPQPHDGSNSSSSFRRRSADDAQSPSTSSIGAQFRKNRYSEDDKYVKSVRQNRYGSPIHHSEIRRPTTFSPEHCNRKRDLNEDAGKKLMNAPGPLDLSSPPPSKRFKEDDSELSLSSPIKIRSECGRSHPSQIVTTKPSNFVPFMKYQYNSKDIISHEKFRLSRNTSKIRLSSDCDESEVQLPPTPSSSTIAPASVEKSPSTSSSCSSAEEIHPGSSSSPNLSRVSPVMPLFRPDRDNAYASFKTSINGPIQVT